MVTVKGLARLRLRPVYLLCAGTVWVVTVEAIQLVTWSTRDSTKSYDELTGG